VGTARTTEWEGGAGQVGDGCRLDPPWTVRQVMKLGELMNESTHSFQIDMVAV
jgi:hypothetical protein